jgi:hypothetical protein
MASDYGPPMPIEHRGKRPQWFDAHRYDQILDR